MSANRLNYLLFVSKPYSFSILNPINKYIINSNIGKTAWFTASTAKNIIPNGNLLKTTKEVLDFNPDAVLVPGNLVPTDWPGIKVQIFHGMDDEVKGYYNINGQFDLYCTHGPDSTSRFKKLAKKYQYFHVQETGWSKLDPLFNTTISNINSKVKYIEKLSLDSNEPIILYAPTFPPKYTSAMELIDAITKLKDKFQWIVKFHTLMDAKIQSEYKKLENSTLKIIDDDDIIPYLEISDILITDTSSVAYEYLPLDRPIITYKGIARKDKGINIDYSSDLHGAILRSLNDPSEFSDNRKFYLNEIHTYDDGKSSERVIEVINDFVATNIMRDLRPKPLNWLRNRRARKLIAE